jgi:SAM-dependent methyltransferase
MENILKWSKNELLQNWFRDEEIFLKSFLKDKNIETVLDVGCGTGRTIDFLLSNFKFKKIVGIEKNPDLVKYLKEKYSKYNSVEIGWTNIIFPEKSYYKLDEKFDLVLCMGNTLGTILNWKLGLKRILERSKKYVILSVYDNMKSIETRKKVYESLGFKIKSAFSLEDNPSSSERIFLRRSTSSRIIVITKSNSSGWSITDIINDFIDSISERTESIFSRSRSVSSMRT